jgi:hypothetical protein
MRSGAVSWALFCGKDLVKEQKMVKIKRNLQLLASNSRLVSMRAPVNVEEE